MAFACLWVPQFTLQSQLRKLSEGEWHPSVLVGGKGKAAVVLEVNKKAQEMGVEPGFSLVRAQARCNGLLQLLPPCGRSEREAQEDLLAVAEYLVGEYENTAPGCVLLNLKSLAGDRKTHFRYWVPHALAVAARLHMSVHVGIASTPDLAHLAAQYSSTAFVSDVECEEHDKKCLIGESGFETIGKADVAILLTLVDIDIELLKSWGIRTLRDLLALDKQELTERLGEGVADAYAILSGEKSRILDLHQVVQSVRAEVDLEYSLNQTDPLLFALQRSLSELCDELKERGLACQFFDLVLVDEEANTIDRRLKLPEPTHQPDVFRLLLQTYLEGLDLSAPIVSFYVNLESVPHLHAERDMFKKGVKDPNRLKVTLADLCNMLGEENVGAIRLRKSHKPDDVELEPWRYRELGQEAEPLLGLPLSRFRPAVPVSVVTDAQAARSPSALLTGPFQGRVIAARGPFRLVGDWWSRHQKWSLVEWDVQLENGELLRLAYQGREKRWTLEGSY